MPGDRDHRVGPVHRALPNIQRRVRMHISQHMQPAPVADFPQRGEACPMELDDPVTQRPGVQIVIAIEIDDLALGGILPAEEKRSGFPSAAAT